MQDILNKLRNTQDNPGFYKALTPEEQAELFLLLLTPKKKVFQKPKVIKGIDGSTPVADKDYISKDTALKFLDGIKTELAKNNSQLEQTIKAKLATVKSGEDAVITDDLIAEVANLASKLVKLPDVSIAITQEPEAIRDSLELLLGDERLEKTAIKGIEEIEKDVEELQKRPKGNNAIGHGTIQSMIDTSIGEIDSDSTPEFEKTSKNLASYPNTLTYTGSNLTSIDYTTDSGTITKTLNYTGDILNTIVLSGDLPTGLTETTKTLTYTGDNLTSIAYS